MKSKKSATTAIVGVIAAIVVVSAVATFFPLTKEKWTELPGGPSINFQLLMTGNASPVLGTEIGTTATYGMYMDNSRVGTFELKAIERMIFQGVECLKTNLTYIRTTPIHDSDNGYTLTDADDKPRYFAVTLDNTRSSEYTWNYAENKISYKLVTASGTTEGEQSLPELENLDTIENLYVGYSENFASYILGDTPSIVTMTVNIPRVEDITVPKGTYRCYVLETSFSLYGTEIKTIGWVDEQGVLPKIKVFETETTFITYELERYGIAG